MNKNRFESYTDAIVAIAATIMVLQLDVPEKNTLAALFAQKDTILAYVVSFFAIYGGWYTHNLVMARANHISNRLYFANGVWLIILTFIPFLSAWVGRSPEAVLPEFLYALAFMLWGFSVLWINYEVERDGCNETISMVLGGKWEPFFIYVPYSIAMVFAFFVPILSLYIVGITTIIAILKRLREKTILEKRMVQKKSAK